MPESKGRRNGAGPDIDIRNRIYRPQSGGDRSGQLKEQGKSPAAVALAEGRAEIRLLAMVLVVMTELYSQRIPYGGSGLAIGARKAR
ncbi:hypothetical protein GCM10027291_46010 [Telluribacter humicola]|nr:hypothetical protein [Telluribacter humicola]